MIANFDKNEQLFSIKSAFLVTFSILNCLPSLQVQVFRFLMSSLDQTLQRFSRIVLVLRDSLCTLSGARKHEVLTCIWASGFEFDRNKLTSAISIYNNYYFTTVHCFLCISIIQFPLGF